MARFRIFLSQCRRRRVRVQLLPQGMAKRNQNTSYYSIKCVSSPTGRLKAPHPAKGCSNGKQEDSQQTFVNRDDTMLWRVEWRFPCAADSKLFSDRYPPHPTASCCALKLALHTYRCTRVSETTTLHAALSSALSDPKRKLPSPLHHPY